MKDSYRVAASLVVYGISDMTDKGRKAICDWLRQLARGIQHEPEACAKTFRARYYYTLNKKARRA
jgi:hypothetical protein